MLRSRWLVFLIGLVGGACAGAGAMLVAFPYLFPPPVADEAMPAVSHSETVVSTSFRFDEKAPGRDRIHWANGSGRVIRATQGWVVRFEADFEAGPGPNYWVYLNTVPVGEEKDFNADQGRLKIAPIKSFRGAQNFVLPEGVDPAKFHTVTVWCESFGAYIGSGVLAKR
jgi:hypothetical protein